MITDDEFREISAFDASFLWEVGVWDDETMVRWQMVRAEITERHARSIVAFMKTTHR